jgi:hypothetical protein
MHGLNQIHSANETAVRQDIAKRKRDAIEAGKSYLINKAADEFELKVFENKSELDAHIRGSIKAGDYHQVEAHYGAL